SSIRDISSDSEASESSIEIQTSPAPKGLITKEPFKVPAVEVEVITTSNQMDLDQNIPVTNEKDKNVSPEERHKWRIPELPPVPKAVETYQSQYKNWFMAAKQQEWELLQSLWIGTINSYLQVKKFRGPEKTEELLKGWTPIFCKGQIQQIKAWFKKQIMLSEDQKKKLVQGKENSPVEAPQASTSKNPPQQVPSKPKQAPKTNKKGNPKAKGKAEHRWNKPCPQNYRISKKEKTAMDIVFSMARTLMEFKNKEEERLNQFFLKK
ncbi:hypothetical protein O181_132820, partial [Austropuccinia psidii MF-1]|nr:hypothetical protein [Austropuccinia psidii MF-1]